MNMLTSAHDYDISSIAFQPFINSPPSDYNTLYSAIKTPVENAQSEYENKINFITFDQRLYLKSVDIAAASCFS